MCECSVCLADLTTGIIQLECGHIFHETCISQWRSYKSEQHPTCPVCRKEVSRQNLEILEAVGAAANTRHTAIDIDGLGRIVSEGKLQLVRTYVRHLIGSVLVLAALVVIIVSKIYRR